ncbi:uncharacterized protein EAF02_002186 [Botrytis sinoallii]|uniref:uncharacterized protein n=1 Tax=Botrytis sinoallii TaxID=1463999 RepID=UPI0019026A2F|nr:uncharacterized protein EAF02_002186 [Botrytis sinoallii]KAF7889771.1 hypothetical protein EAF02_002186 [Botrytis sinoallii]
MRGNSRSIDARRHEETPHHPPSQHSQGRGHQTEERLSRSAQESRQRKMQQREEARKAGYTQYPQPWPPKTVSEWNEYHRLQSIHEAERDAYYKAFHDQVAACALEKNSKHPYSQWPIALAGHAALEQPALNWKEGAQNHGNARQAFVDRYPHSYPSPQDNENHRKIAQNQFLDAEHAQQRLNIHRQYGSANTPPVFNQDEFPPLH